MKKTFSFDNKWLGGCFFVKKHAEIAKKIGKIVKQEGPEAPNGTQILQKWVTSPSHAPAVLRAEATGKGREGDKSPSQGLGRKGFMNLRSSASTCPEAKRLGGFRIKLCKIRLQFNRILITIGPKCDQNFGSWICSNSDPSKLP